MRPLVQPNSIDSWRRTYQRFWHGHRSERHIRGNMKRSYLHPLYLCFAVLIAMITLAVPAAYAFTVETKNNSNSDGSPKFTDPDEKVEQFGHGSATTQQGNTTFQFGARSSNGLNQLDGSFGSSNSRAFPR